MRPVAYESSAPILDCVWYLGKYDQTVDKLCNSPYMLSVYVQVSQMGQTGQ